MKNQNDLEVSSYADIECLSILEIDSNNGVLLFNPNDQYILRVSRKKWERLFRRFLDFKSEESGNEDGARRDFLLQFTGEVCGAKELVVGYNDFGELREQFDVVDCVDANVDY